MALKTNVGDAPEDTIIPVPGTNGELNVRVHISRGQKIIAYDPILTSDISVTLHGTHHGIPTYSCNGEKNAHPKYYAAAKKILEDVQDFISTNEHFPKKGEVIFNTRRQQDISLHVIYPAEGWLTRFTKHKEQLYNALKAKVQEITKSKEVQAILERDKNLPPKYDPVGEKKRLAAERLAREERNRREQEWAQERAARAAGGWQQRHEIHDVPPLAASGAARLDPYEVLGISPNATDAAVKKAYRMKSFENHPDTSRGNTEAQKRFIDATAAYEAILAERGIEKSGARVR